MSVQIVRESPDLTLATLIASSGFVQPVSPELRTDVDTHLHEGQLVYSILDRRETIGFAIFKLFDPRVLYLGGIILREDYQGTGIAPQMVELARRETEAVWLGLRTQSPRMWAAARKMVRRIYPSPSEDFDLVCLFAAHGLAQSLGMTASRQEGFYGGPLYGQKPVHRDSQIQDWWDSICQFERGDAVVVAGMF